MIRQHCCVHPYSMSDFSRDHAKSRGKFWNFIPFCDRLCICKCMVLIVVISQNELFFGHFPSGSPKSDWYTGNVEAPYLAYLLMITIKESTRIPGFPCNWYGMDSRLEFVTEPLSHRTLELEDLCIWKLSSPEAKNLFGIRKGPFLLSLVVQYGNFQIAILFWRKTSSQFILYC